jgi:phosphoglycolate phosphatase
MNPLNDYAIEIINPDLPRGQIRHALFDFDGTISLIREGWQGVMIPMMVDLLMQTPQHESEEEIRAVVTEFVTRLTGKQTIYQMIRLTEEIEKRGGQPLPALDYKWMYLNALQANIDGRLTRLKAGEVTPEALMVPEAGAMLAALETRNVTCYLASGTDEAFVLAESAALGLHSYFAGIYGALDDYKNFSKKMVIDRILTENSLSGAQLVAFGDGYVEIEDTKAAGGIAVGVASDEVNRQGIDEWKRNRLIEAGADIIIPDFRQYERLMAFLFAED